MTDERGRHEADAREDEDDEDGEEGEPTAAYCLYMSRIWA
jgi:hypothetical protein